MKELLLLGLMIVSGASLYAMEGDFIAVSHDRKTKPRKKIQNFLNQKKPPERNEKIPIFFNLIKDCKELYKTVLNDLPPNKLKILEACSKVKEQSVQEEWTIEEIDRFTRMLKREHSNILIEFLEKKKNRSQDLDEELQNKNEEHKPHSSVPEATFADGKNTSMSEGEDFYFPVSRQIFTKQRILIGSVGINAVMVILGSSYGIYCYVKNAHAKGKQTVFDRLFAKMRFKKKLNIGRLR